MQIIVFGATGTIGREVVTEGLAQGHEITAFARRPERLGITHARLRSVAGDVLDANAVATAMAGHDAAVVTLGDGARGGVRAAGTRHVVAAMHTHGVRRLVGLSTLGAGDSRSNLNFFWRRIMFGVLLKRALADHEAQEAVIRGSDLDWTIVRPASFTDALPDAHVRHGFDPSARDLSLKVPKVEVARFMLAQVRDLTYLHASPALSM